MSYIFYNIISYIGDMWDVPSIEIMRLKKSVFYYFLPEIKKWLNGMEFFLLQENAEL